MTALAPAVAGTFYPESPSALRTMVCGFLDEVNDAASRPKALILPHAGYIYSGPIAASGYASIQGAAKRISRVVLVGPSHYFGFEGMRLPASDALSTPLGNVPIDPECEGLATRHAQVLRDDTPFRGEHSLEVHLPFLQLLLGRFSLVPLLVGQSSAQQTARVVRTLWGSDETLWIVSSDLSHFLDYEAASVKDSETARHIEGLQGEAIGGDRACGHVAVRGLLRHGCLQHMRCMTLDLRNSGDTAGDRQRVVGYGAFALYA